jgi:dUTP pyrophosphatase
MFRKMASNRHILYLQPDVEMVDTYKAAATAYLATPYLERDAGFDLFAKQTTMLEAGPPTKLTFGVRAAYYDRTRGFFRAYWMLPRSSISKTPLRLANSVGLIDAGYRGPLIAALDCHAETYEVTALQKLCQLSNPDLLPWEEIQVVEVIPGGATLRGEGGFGSTDHRSVDLGPQSGRGSTDLRREGSGSADTPRPASSPGFSPTVHEYNAYGC